MHNLTVTSSKFGDSDQQSWSSISKTFHEEISIARESGNYLSGLQLPPLFGGGTGLGDPIPAQWSASLYGVFRILSLEHGHWDF